MSDVNNMRNVNDEDACVAGDGFDDQGRTARSRVLLKVLVWYFRFWSDTKCYQAWYRVNLYRHNFSQVMSTTKDLGRG